MAQHDQLHRYLFEQFAVRGELVTVSETWKQILENHNYPLPVKTLLGELLVATSLLTATLKFAGDITVQLQGDGPMSLAVINGNYALDSGLTADEALYKESDYTDNSYFGLIAARTEDAENPVYLRIVEAYQSQKTIDIFNNEFAGFFLPAWELDIG